MGDRFSKKEHRIDQMVELLVDRNLDINDWQKERQDEKIVQTVDGLRKMTQEQIGALRQLIVERFKR